MPLFEVVIYETIEHRFEVYARDENDAESIAYDGFPVSDGYSDGIASQSSEQMDYEIQDAKTEYLGDDPD